MSGVEVIAEVGGTRGLPNSSGSLAWLCSPRCAGPRRAAAVQTVAKILVSALWRSAKLLCRISNIPPALQSCETLPEGWPCLSMDSAQIGGVKVS